MATDVQEIEWQFDALDLRPVERWLDRPTGLDGVGPVRTATTAVRSRNASARSRARSRCSACSRSAPTRRVFTLEVDGAPRADIALDDAAIQPATGEPPVQLRRVEVEVPESAVATVSPVVEALRAACALHPAALSKYEVGLLSADLRPPTAARFGSTATSADSTIGEVALVALRRHFSAFLAHEPGTRLGDDIEELHDMRVASRRLRAALALFADFLPEEFARMRDELGQPDRTRVGARRVPPPANPREAAALHARVPRRALIAERYRRSMEELRAQFPAAYARVKGKPWRALRRTIEEQRPPDSETGPAGDSAWAGL